MVNYQSIISAKLLGLDMEVGHSAGESRRASPEMQPRRFYLYRGDFFCEWDFTGTHYAGSTFATTPTLPFSSMGMGGVLAIELDG